MTKKQGKAYVCEGCGTAYPTKLEADACESKHRLLEMWQEGKVDDLAVAQGLGLPTETPHERESSLRSVRNMLMKGADASLSADTLRGAAMREAPPIFMNATKIFSNGATQVPAEIRGIWGVKDGDFLFWYRQGDTILVAPQAYTAQHRQPHFMYQGKEPSPP